jgi:diaminopimelate decarboxylase
LTAGVIIHLESENEVFRVARIGNSLGITPQVMVRVNPDFELKSSGMKMGGGASQFGIDSELVPNVLKQIDSLGMKFLGLHIYAGSQNLSPLAIIEAQNKTFEMAINLAQESLQKVHILNIGGGFGIPYFAGDTPLDIKPIGENLRQWLPRLSSKLPGTKVVVELGRYLVGEAGIYVSKVIDRKMSRGHTFIVCDGGMNHHLAASGNLGQTIRKNYHVVVGNKILGKQRKVVTVTGPLCTPLDVIAGKMELACSEPGDLIVVFQSGAYGLSASPTGFLSHALPKEVLV